MTNKLRVLKRLNDIEKQLQKLNEKWQTYKGIFWMGLGGGIDYETTDAATILGRINEIYDFLGVKRESVASKTFLKKKPANKK